MVARKRLGMFFSTNKEKGRAGLSMGIAYFGSNGYNVSITLNDTQDYDLVVEKDNIFQKVQCKSTGKMNKNKLSYIVKLDSYGGLNGGTYYGTVKDGAADLLFILTANKDMYLIPTSIVVQARTLTLTNDYDKYKVYL